MAKSQGQSVNRRLAALARLHLVPLARESQVTRAHQAPRITDHRKITALNVPATVINRQTDGMPLPRTCVIPQAWQTARITLEASWYRLRAATRQPAAINREA